MLMTSWKTRVDGVLTSGNALLQFEVREIGGLVRYLVFRRSAPDVAARELLGSGTATNPRLAMSAAQRLAERLERS